MAEDPINPLLGFFNALEQKKGAKGVINDGKKVSATLTPEETARYTNIFKIMKDVVNPGPEAGTIAATPEATTPAGSTGTTDSTNTDKEKKDGFSLSSLLGLLPALGPALALLGPALAGAVVAGLATINWKEIFGISDKGLVDTAAEHLAKWLQPPMTEEQVDALVTKQTGVNKQSLTAMKKSNEYLRTLQDLALERASKEERERIQDINKTLNDIVAGKVKMDRANIQRLRNERQDLIDKQLTDAEREESFRLRYASLQLDREHFYRRQKEISKARDEREEEIARLNEELRDNTSKEGSNAAVSNKLNEYGRLKKAEDEELDVMISRLQGNRITEKNILNDYIRFKLGSTAMYNMVYDPNSSANINLSNDEFLSRTAAFTNAMRKQFKDEFKIQKADDIVVNSNGDYFNLDSQDSLVAAKPGGPIDKMLDQNSAIQSQQLNVLVAIRQEVTAIRSSMSSNVSVAGTALTQEFYAQ